MNKATMTDHPYANLPGERFWRTGVAERGALDLAGLYERRFPLRPSDRIATIGSCFAQHIGRTLKARGWSVLDAEPPPPGLPEDQRSRFGYGLFSARYGNVYTVAQFRQLLDRAFRSDPTPDQVWSAAGRFHDPYRPTIEPGGFASAEEMLESRADHLRRVKTLFSGIDVLIFTLGLTEAWHDRRDGTVYPTCPGVVAGRFDPALHGFRNFDYPRIRTDLAHCLDVLRGLNPDLRVVLTVSPVPLTATAEARHVMLSTAYSKATLRAVAGDLQAERPYVDYFPSYEMVTSPSSRGCLYDANMRSVSREGVGLVMDAFLAAHADGLPSHPPASAQPAPDEGAGETAQDVMCDDLILEHFNGRA